MKIDFLVDQHGYYFDEYDEFNVGNEDSGYLLTVGELTGGTLQVDIFDHIRNQQFYTSDHDSPEVCAASEGFGSWFSYANMYCNGIHLNGKGPKFYFGEATLLESRMSLQLK